MLILLAATALALAETPGVVAKGTGVLSAEAGLSTFATLQHADGARPWDRVHQPQLALGSRLGLTDRLQAGVSIPLVSSSVVDDPTTAPCPSTLPSEDFCGRFVTAGTARAELRYGLLRKKTRLTAGIAASGDPWNAPRRGQRNAVDTGRTHLEGLLVTGRRIDRGDWILRGVVLGAYGRALSPQVTSLDGSSLLRAPADTFRATLEGRLVPPGPAAVDLGVHWSQRLGGVALDDAWEDQWLAASLDRWNVLATRRLTLSGRFGVALPADSGLHLRVARTVLAANGPADHTEVALGWHKVFSRQGVPR